MEARSKLRISRGQDLGAGINFTEDEWDEFAEKLDAFLIGTGREEQGLVAEILEATELEKFRNILNDRGGGKLSSRADIASNPDRVDAALVAVKGWMVLRAWQELQFQLMRPEQVAVAEHAQLNT
jgi:hypothetical protein